MPATDSAKASAHLKQCRDDSLDEAVGFGGGGPHFCLGAHLARREINVMIREILTRLPDIEISGEPTWTQSRFVNGIKHLPCRFTPVAPSV